MISTRIIESASELESIEQPWQSLIERSGSVDYTVAPFWLLPWWRVYGSAEGRKLRVAAFFDGAQLVGLAPLLTRRSWYRGVLPLRRIEPLASGEREEEETCSMYLSPIIERGRESEVSQAFADALKAGRFGPFEQLVLPHMKTDAPVAAAMPSELRRVGLAVDIRDGRECPHVPLPATFEAYLEQLSPKRRYNVRRSLRDLEKWGAGTLSMKFVRSSEDLAHGKDILIRLHRGRWQEEGHTGAFDSLRFREFHDSVMPQLLERGALELMWLEAHGEPIAALYTIVWDQKVYAYQMGRRCDLPKGLRPGIAIHAMAIQRGIELGRSDYDFGGGNSRYKSDLATSVRPLIEVRAETPSFLNAARAVMERGEEQVRLLKRRFRARPVAALAGA
jgi:CelD/BcsL family acetyltransferase involved in cellulose biosynthesis